MSKTLTFRNILICFCSSMLCYLSGSQNIVIFGVIWPPGRMNIYILVQCCHKTTRFYYKNSWLSHVNNTHNFLFLFLTKNQFKLSTNSESSCVCYLWRRFLGDKVTSRALFHFNGTERKETKEDK